MIRILGFLVLAYPCSIWFCYYNASGLKVISKEQIQVDSVKLLTSLYKDVKVIPSKTFADFSYDLLYDDHAREVTVKSSKNVEETMIEYFIVFKFLGNDFDRSTFSTSDDAVCQYVTSYFKVDNDSINLERSLRNNQKEKVAPSLLWYGKDFGITGRCYKFKGKQYFLLRGLDLYCNGHHCTAYQLFAIEKYKSHSKVEVFESAAVYPYDFENTFLFDKHGDGYPDIYLPKQDPVESEADFELLTLFHPS